jgi:type III restriction enzyme
MKLHFESNLDYQLQAIDAVCDLFRGQEMCRTEFTVTQQALGGALLPGMENDLGVGNRLTLLDDELLRNLNEIQLRNGLPQSQALASGDFTVEMETGTGKTYVYLRTIFELNKRYGFTKFVIVVPSVAIKEGVFKSLQITEAHFKALYAGTPVDFFIYDSGKLGQVRNFATSAQIQIMVVTVGAINKQDVNNLYKESEKTGGERPIDLIRATRPIVIVDEPQSVDGGLRGAGKAALAEMKPLCTLRYSATHANKHHMVYRLDAVDAYDQGLVKRIEVASATVEDAHNKPYVRLVKVRRQGSTLTAIVELDVQASGAIRRKEITVRSGDDLEQTAERAIYRHCRIGEIQLAKGSEFMELQVPGGERFLRPGEAWNDVDSSLVQRQMIQRTIREHLEKERLLRPHGIKVLSLFFIDEVANYREYDAAGNPAKGLYARIFEEEYRKAAGMEKYGALFSGMDPARAAEEAHDGYFSIDRKGGWTDTEENNQANRDNAERAYTLIMKDKERLLSFATPLKFIFSHSALREGWDNPNVFQICTLRDIRTERERRQTIGRGLRLCVNQEGQRLRDSKFNTLTVIATESYEEFASKLQEEIEADTGIRFGIVESHQFASLTTRAADGSVVPLGTERSELVWDHLKVKGYIDGKGRVQDSLRTALKDGSLSLPDEIEPQRELVCEMLRKVSGRLDIKNADERRPIRPRKAVLHSPEFKALWDRIKHKTTYRVQFDNERLVESCTTALRAAPPIPRTRLQWRKADIAIGEAGVTAIAGKTATVNLDEPNIELPDILTELQDRTQLTRRTICRILVDSERLDHFQMNPTAFIELAAEVINRCKRLAIVEGIKYQRLGDEHYYAQELFEQEELTGYLKNMLDVKKAVYEQVVYDAGSEERFAEAMERNEAIRVYAKLPGWFTVPTPLGSYNPDWAVLVENDGEERLYFVVETKGSLFTDDLRETESAKITCGKAHFLALQATSSAAKYIVARSVDDLLAQT